MRVAHLVRGRFPDGQLHLDLRGSQQRPLPPAQALAYLLQGLGADAAEVPADETARAALLRTLLSGRRVLLFLDDAADAAQLRPLLPGTSSAAVLVTSRANLAELPGAYRVGLDVLPPDEAAALFARAVGPQRAATEPAATQAVLAACAGLPLALRIAAARLSGRPTWPVAYLAGRLRDARGRLAELRVGELAVRATFQVSYDSLPLRGAAGEGPARTFRMLGLVAGADVAVPAVAALLDEPEADAESDLEALVDVHLVGTPAPGRYRCHDLLHDFAVELVAEVEPPEAREAALKRMLARYLGAVLAARRLIAPGSTPGETLPEVDTRTEFADRDAAIAWCEAEYRNVVAAVGQAMAAGMHAHAAHLAMELHDFLYQRTYLDVIDQLSGMALEAAAATADHSAEARLLRSLAYVAIQRQRHDRAVELLRRALAANQRAGDRIGECAVLCTLAVAYQAVGRAPDSLDVLHRALAISRELRHGEAEASVLNNLGWTLRSMGRSVAAEEACREAIEVSRKLGHRVLEGIALGNVALLRCEAGAHAEAIEAGGEAAEILGRTGFRTAGAGTLGVLARSLLGVGRRAEAVKRLCEARDLFAEIGSPLVDVADAQLAAIDAAADDAEAIAAFDAAGGVDTLTSTV